MDPGEYESIRNEYNKRMDPDKYVKFADCFHRLIQGTNVTEATSMLTVGIGELVYINAESMVTLGSVISTIPKDPFASSVSVNAESTMQISRSEEFHFGGSSHT